MKFTILTLFPEMIDGMIGSSIVKRAIEKAILEIEIINFRDFAGNKHATVDDYAYGGGAGMLIRVDPIHRALQTVSKEGQSKVLLTSPTGTVFNQKMAEELAKLDHIIIICGHYEGIDYRINKYIDDEISIGDYVLTGGEIPACIIIDAVARLIPGVISDQSLDGESFTMGLLEYQQYTRPQEYDGQSVPDVLLSGHHANIKKWQRYEALKKTYRKRPDLLEKLKLTDDDLVMLKEIEEDEK